VTPIRRHLLSRRGFCLCCLGSATFAATGGWLTPSQVFAEARNLVDLIRSEAAKAPIKVHRLRGNVSVLEGSGGNVAVLTGRDGKLLVDAGITASRPRITEALASLSSDPVKHLINTHWHFDHADGNEWLHGEGATILAHENTRKHLATAQRVEDWNFDFPPSPADGRAERFPDLASELVRLKVDLIMTRGTPATIAAKNATGTIPVVMASMCGPGAIVPSFSHPGGNITGVITFSTELTAKRIDIIKELVPNLSRVALLHI
jgi:Metallo-beta-lactamase superfamily/ABC transporter substrate binding protein